MHKKLIQKHQKNYILGAEKNNQKLFVIFSEVMEYRANEVLSRET